MKNIEEKETKKKKKKQAGQNEPENRYHKEHGLFRGAWMGIALRFSAQSRTTPHLELSAWPRICPMRILSSGRNLSLCCNRTTH